MASPQRRVPDQYTDTTTRSSTVNTFGDKYVGRISTEDDIIATSNVI